MDINERSADEERAPMIVSHEQEILATDIDSSEVRNAAMKVLGW